MIGAHVHARLAPNYLANLTFKQLFVEPNIDTNISVQKNYTLYVGAGYVGSTVDTSYSLYVEKPVNAVNNYGSVINGNLGINTDTPSYTLDVVGSSKMKTTDTTNTQLYLQSAGTSSLINYKNSVYDISNTWSAGISYDSTINNYYQISCSDNTRA